MDSARRGRATERPELDPSRDLLRLSFFHALKAANTHAPVKIRFPMCQAFEAKGMTGTSSVALSFIHSI